MGVGVEVGAEAGAEAEGEAERIRAASRNPWTTMMPPRSSPPEQLSPSTQTLNPSHSPAPRPQSPPANRLHLARSRAIQSPRRSRASSASTVRNRTWRQVRPDWRTERTRAGETTVGRRRGTRARSRMRQSPRKPTRRSSAMPTRRSNAMLTRRSKVLANPNRKTPPRHPLAPHPMPPRMMISSGSTTAPATPTRTRIPRGPTFDSKAN